MCGEWNAGYRDKVRDQVEEPDLRDEANERLPREEPTLPTIVPELTAVIHNAAIVGDRLVGTVFDHARFENGEIIRTSPIVATFVVHVTRSGSYYLVEDKREQVSGDQIPAERRAVRDWPQA